MAINNETQDNWSPQDIPDLTNKIAIVTGGYSGIGAETVKILAEHGAHVIVAGRNMEKAEGFVNQLRRHSTELNISAEKLDLSNLDSVKTFAEQFIRKYNQLHLLINNGGISMSPYKTTEQGFESHIGVNYLSHYVLTASLLGLIKATPDARVVNVTSNLASTGKIDPTFMAQNPSNYIPEQAYANSKLALILFTQFLQNQVFSKNYPDKKAISSDPGGTDTPLLKRQDTPLKWKIGMIVGSMLKLSQNATQGAYTTIRAAVDKTLNGGDHVGSVGPTIFGKDMNLKGLPKKKIIAPGANNIDLQNLLLEITIELTGIDITREG